MVLISHAKFGPDPEGCGSPKLENVVNRVFSVVFGGFSAAGGDIYRSE